MAEVVPGWTTVTPTLIRASSRMSSTTNGSCSVCDQPVADRGRVVAVLDQYGELVATEPGQACRPDGADRRSRSATCTRSWSPAAWPRRVVDPLEVVEVAEQHGERPAVDGVQVERVLDPVGEQVPVGQAGQLVVEGLLLQLASPARRRPRPAGGSRRR